MKPQTQLGLVAGKICVKTCHNGLDPDEKCILTKKHRPENTNAEETQKELDPCFDAVKISIRNCKRPGCKHSTEKRPCIWPQPCPADCFEQFPPSTRPPKCFEWPLN